MNTTAREIERTPRNGNGRSAIFHLPSSILYLLLSLGYISTGLAQGVSASAQPDILSRIGIEQNLNEQMPLNLPFRDEEGLAVELGKYFGEKPVILVLVYYECPMLCNMILNGLLRSLNTLNFDVGKEFDVVTVSFDPDETAELARSKKQSYISKYGREGAEKGWHFLTGEQSSIQALTEAVGFRYEYDAQTDQFAHASAIMVTTPDGKLSRYFYGVEYSARDLRLGLVEAAEGKVGSVVDQVLLYCFHYDPTTGKYGLVVMNVVRVLGTATVFGLGAFMFIMFRRDRKTRTSKNVAVTIED